MYIIKEHSQAINDRNWWKCGTNDICGFFYVLVWSDPVIPNRKILKFGYKLSAIAYKKNYAEPSQPLPLSSDLWIVTCDYDFKNNISHRKNKDYFQQFIRRKESQINRILKNHKSFTRCDKSREYYQSFDYLFAIRSIRSSLYDFNEELKNYQIESEKQGSIRMRPLIRGKSVGSC